MNGQCHFSTLKKFALSPAHFRSACDEPAEPTAAMRFGTIVHAMLLGPRRGNPLVVYPGKTRQGNAWKEFDAAHAGVEIVTQTEWDAAIPAAWAIATHPLARALAAGSYFEVPLRWKSAGIDCETSGIDIVGSDFIAEVKTSTSAQPEWFARQCVKMHYHAQAAFYLDAARANGLNVSRGFFEIVVEVKPPHAVTVFEMTEPLLELGTKSIALWLERLRACQDEGHWPAYAQGIVPLEAPAWLLDEEDDGDEVEESAA